MNKCMAIPKLLKFAVFNKFLIIFAKNTEKYVQVPFFTMILKTRNIICVKFSSREIISRIFHGIVISVRLWQTTAAKVESSHERSPKMIVSYYFKFNDDSIETLSPF